MSCHTSHSHPFSKLWHSHFLNGLTLEVRWYCLGNRAGQCPAWVSPRKRPGPGRGGVPSSPSHKAPQTSDKNPTSSLPSPPASLPLTSNLVQTQCYLREKTQTKIQNLKKKRERINKSSSTCWEGKWLRYGKKKIFFHKMVQVIINIAQNNEWQGIPKMKKKKEYSNVLTPCGLKRKGSSENNDMGRKMHLQNHVHEHTQSCKSNIPLMT